MSQSSGNRPYLCASALALLCISCTASPVALEPAGSDGRTVLMASDGSSQAGRQSGSLSVDGEQRTYTLYTPSTHNLMDPLPLVVALHGGLGSGDQFAGTTGFDAVAEADRFLTVYPDAIDGTWNDGRNEGPNGPEANDVDFIAALIEEISRTRTVNLDRVYVTGISNGGFMTGRLACDRPELFAGFAIVASSLEETINETCPIQNPGSVLIIHGTADRLIPYRGGEDPGGNPILSVADATQFWVQANGCSRFGRSRWLSNTDRRDGTRIVETIYRNCDQYPVQLLTIWGGGHTWPGGKGQPQFLVGTTSQDINGSQAVWDFFKDLP